jgi:integrase/recombinase XerD
MFQDVCERAGVGRDWAPRDLRHTFVSLPVYDGAFRCPTSLTSGHVDLSTTEIYARASTEAKRKALEAVYADVVTADLAEWNQNPELLSWLASL